MLHLQRGGSVRYLKDTALSARHRQQTLPVAYHAGLLIAIRREADVQLQCELFNQCINAITSL
jgi:hypothetical protein